MSATGAQDFRQVLDGVDGCHEVAALDRGHIEYRLLQNHPLYSLQVDFQNFFFV